MLIDVFKHEFKQRNGVMLTDSIVLVRKPLELYDMANDKTIAVFKGKNLDAVFAFEIDGQTVREIIEGWDAMPVIALNGGRGGGSGIGDWTGKFGHAAGGRGSGNDKSDHPARLNVKLGNARSPEDMLKAFRDAHVNDSYESGVAVDEYGYVTRYVHGGATSVGIYGGKGEMVYHNHPGEKGGNFSDSDLLSTAMSAERGIVASGREGDYIFVKTHKFNATGFTKAVKNATLRGKDYTDAADRWLKANQKKYGYKYSFKKA